MGDAKANPEFVPFQINYIPQNDTDENEQMMKPETKGCHESYNVSSLFYRADYHTDFIMYSILFHC